MVNRFSNLFCLQVPEPLIPQAGARVMSLTDGLSKVKYSHLLVIYFSFRILQLHYSLLVLNKSNHKGDEKCS